MNLWGEIAQKERMVSQPHVNFLVSTIQKSRISLDTTKWAPTIVTNGFIRPKNNKWFVLSKPVNKELQAQ